MSGKLKIREVTCKEIIVKSNLPKAPYVANPYTGCGIGCVYCYADFMRRWTGHVEEKWGEFVDVKVNAENVVVNQNHGNKDILFSSVTEPYQPIEFRYKLTRKLLEQLAKQTPQPSVGILTKSPLVTRDIDVLKNFRKCTVGFSFCTLDDNVRRVLEPVTLPISKRIEAVKTVREAGIKTYVFISPIMPYLTNIESIVAELRPYVDFFMFENLNIRPSLWPRIREALEKIDTGLVSRYEDIYFLKGGKERFWKPIERQIRAICVRESLEPYLFFHHS